MIDPLPVWLAEFEKLPPDADGTKAPKEIANFLDQRVTKKLGLKNSPVTLSPPPQFTWQKGIFQPLLFPCFQGLKNLIVANFQNHETDPCRQ